MSFVLAFNFDASLDLGLNLEILLLKVSDLLD